MELIQVLAENNITSFDDIRRQEPHRIEMVRLYMLDSV